MNKHYLIWGGGLAGTFLTSRLILAGQKVTLIDDRLPYSASRVAAGLFNVITGRFGAKSWMADKLLDEIKAYFQLLPFQPLSTFLHYSPIYRPFKEIAEYNKWTGRVGDPEYAHLVDFQEEPLLPEILHNEHGGIFIKPCGWLDTTNFLLGMQQLLIRRYGMEYIPQRVTYDQLDIQERILNTDLGKIHFDDIVFCEGFAGADNPYFPQVSIIPNKGEILHIEIPDVEFPFVLSRKVYLIPMTHQQYLVGSTYQKDFDHPDPTPEGREEIEFHLKKALKVPFKVLDHVAGIRPTTPNRRMILGTHPDLSYVHIFSGLGTKGVLQGPYGSRLMVEKLLGKPVNIPEEVKVARFG